MSGVLIMQCTHLGAGFSTPSPEASGPIRQIVFGLSLEVSEYRKHEGRSFPGNLTFGIEVSHRVARSFVVAQNFGDQLHSRVIGVFMLLVLIRAVDPEFESLFHSQFHVGSCRE